VYLSIIGVLSLIPNHRKSMSTSLSHKENCHVPVDNEAIVTVSNFLNDEIKHVTN